MTTLVVLAVVFGVLHFTRQAIPERPLLREPPPNASPESRQRYRDWRFFYENPSAYQRRAADDAVRWYPLAPHALLAARTPVDRPIMLVAGTSWSQQAERFDSTLKDPEIAALLNRDFVSIRVDLHQSPEWSANLLPLIEGRQALDPGFQVWFFDSNGRLLAAVEQTASLSWPQSSEILTQDLRSVRNAMQQLLAESSGRTVGSELDREQMAQVERLLHTGAFQGRVASLEGAIAGLMNTAYGGFEFDNSVRLQPLRWQYLLQRDRPELAAIGIDPLLEGPLMDWVDQGVFFRQPKGADRSYERNALVHVQTLRVAAHLHALTDEARYLDLAEVLAGGLDVYWTPDGYVPGYHPRTGAYYRSRRHSFSAAELRRAFNAEERRWLAARLSLDPAENPHMVPVLASYAHYRENREEYDAMLKRLRDLRQADEQTLEDGDAFAEMCLAGARAYEAWRLLQATENAPAAAEVRAFADRVYEAARELQIGDNEIQNRYSLRERAYLDYLAFSDLAMHRFLTTGEPAALINGAAVLRRGVELHRQFENPSARVVARFSTILRTRDSAALGFPDIATPTVQDNVVPSTAGLELRLFVMYSAAATSAEAADEWRSLAEITEARYGGLTRSLGSAAASLATASDLARKDWVLVCDDDPVAAANRLAAERPSVLVVPRTEVVRPDADLPDGAIICHGQKLGVTLP
jgi:uncharacterized protein YyaL (SSP411 family)